MYTEQISERLALGNGIVPQSLNNARLNSDAIDMQQSRRAFFVLSIGANSGSISAWLQEDDNTNFTNASNDTAGSFSNSGGTQVSLTGLTTASKEYTFEVRAGQLTAGKRYVRLQIKENNVGAVLVCVVCWGDEGIHKPDKANKAGNVSTQNVVT